MDGSVVPDLLRIGNTALIGIVAWVLKDAWGELRDHRRRLGAAESTLAVHGARLENAETDIRELRTERHGGRS